MSQITLNVKNGKNDQTIIQIKSDDLIHIKNWNMNKDKEIEIGIYKPEISYLNVHVFKNNSMVMSMSINDILITRAKTIILNTNNSNEITDIDIFI